MTWTIALSTHIRIALNNFRLREIADIWRCQKVLSSASCLSFNHRTTNTWPNKREVVAQRFACYSTRTSEIKRWIRYSDLLDLRNRVHDCLLGFLRLHSSTHEQRTVPDSIRSTASVVLETRRSSIHCGDDSYVNLFVVAILNLLLQFFHHYLYLAVQRRYLPWCDEATWLLTDRFSSVFTIKLLSLLSVASLSHFLTRYHNGRCNIKPKSETVLVFRHETFCSSINLPFYLQWTLVPPLRSIPNYTLEKTNYDWNFRDGVLSTWILLSLLQWTENILPPLKTNWRLSNIPHHLSTAPLFYKF